MSDLVEPGPRQFRCIRPIAYEQAPPPPPSGFSYPLAALPTKLLASLALLTLAACQAAAPGPPAPPPPAAPGSPPAPAETAVLTQKGDNARLGWDSHETALGVGSVDPARFGRRVAYPVDGKVYAQPLFVPGLEVAGRTHNAAIVATERDSVYAFDADVRSPAAPLWHASLAGGGGRPLDSKADLGCEAIAPKIGRASCRERV